jgi:hypothetical protein
LECSSPLELWLGRQFHTPHAAFQNQRLTFFCSITTLFCFIATLFCPITAFFVSSQPFFIPSQEFFGAGQGRPDTPSKRRQASLNREYALEKRNGGARSCDAPSQKGMGDASSPEKSSALLSCSAGTGDEASPTLSATGRRSYAHRPPAPCRQTPGRADKRLKTRIPQQKAIHEGHLSIHEAH